jgi:hypothetical protein
MFALVRGKGSPYGSDDPNYPYALITFGNAHVSRVHNLSEPYGHIGDDIDGLLQEGETFVHDLAGSFTMYYFKSNRYGGNLAALLFHTRLTLWQIATTLGQALSGCVSSLR